MVRPKQCRRIAALPGSALFKPAGIPACALREIVLAVDEFEALRLADYEGLYQDQAAERMRISRQTFGRIVEAARKKVAQALVNGQALRIEGGEIQMAKMRAFQCAECQHLWEVPFGAGRPAGCPACQGKNFHRAVEVAVGPVETEQAPPAGRGGRGQCRRQGSGPGPRGPARRGRNRG